MSLSRSHLESVVTMLAMGVAVPDFMTNRIRTKPPTGSCIQCGKTKHHNNSFCSAECCKAHKEKSSDARS